MDKRATRLAMELLAEGFKGNLSIRLYRYKGGDGSTRHRLDLVTWNTWAEQAKLLYSLGGISQREGQKLFETFRNGLSHYDWIHGEMVFEKR